MLTRDSIIWTIGLLAAIAGYLVTAQTPPTQWTYMQWLQAATFILAWVMGRLSSSPLAGDSTPHKETYTALGGILRMKE